MRISELQNNWDLLQDSKALAGATSVIWYSKVVWLLWCSPFPQSSSCEKFNHIMLDNNELEFACFDWHILPEN